MDKKIIVDCDRVLLDWGFAFDVWMKEQGFNESGCVGFLPAFRDSVEYVTKLHNLGWKFEVISCLDKDKYAQSLRTKNLIYLFGEVFDFIDCGLDFTVGKRQYLLERYSNKNYYWIEDSISHAESGKKNGLTSIIMDHPYNQEWNGLRVKNWKQVYRMINDTTH